MTRFAALIGLALLAAFSTAAQAGFRTAMSGSDVMQSWDWDSMGSKPLASAKARGKATSKSAAKSQRVAKAAPESFDDDVRPQKRGFKAKAPSYQPGLSAYQSGIASYYWQPQRVASGGWFNPNAMTAAHKSLPFGTRVRVTHSRSGRTVDVTINDRGPYIAGRIIDLSSAAAGVLGIKGSGVAPVSVAILGR